MAVIRVLIADDNVLQRELYQAMLQPDKGIEVVCVAQNGAEALAGIRQYQPDAVLFDMVMPQLDGFGLLGQVHQQKLPHMPKMIALTSLGRDDFIVRAVALGVDDYLIKPVDAAQLSQRIHDLCPTPQPTLPEAQPILPTVPPEPETLSDDSIRKYAAVLLMQLDMPAHLHGYQYLLEALTLAVPSPSLVNHMVSQLYPAVAARCQTTPSRVERSIRNAIAIAWDRGAASSLNKLLGHPSLSPSPKPSNSELIAQLAARIRLKEGR